MKEITYEEICSYIELCDKLKELHSIEYWEDADQVDILINSKTSWIIVVKILKELGFFCDIFDNYKIPRFTKEMVINEMCSELVFEVGDMLQTLVLYAYEHAGWSVFTYDIENFAESVCEDMGTCLEDVINTGEVLTQNVSDDILREFLGVNYELCSPVVKQFLQAYEEGSFYTTEYIVFRNEKFSRYLKVIADLVEYRNSPVANAISNLIGDSLSPMPLHMINMVYDGVFEDDYLITCSYWYIIEDHENLFPHCYVVERALAVILLDKLIDIAFQELSGMGLLVE